MRGDRVKPLGVFAGPRPAWASFACLPDWADFREAAEDSRASGVKWVLILNGMPRTDPLTRWLPAITSQLRDSGVLPHIVGVCYHEEWYSQWKGGAYEVPGLDHTNPKHWISGARAIAWWTSEQHKAIKAALGLPIVWLENFVNDDPQFGGWWYQPVPAGVDVLALEAYVSTSGTFASDVEPFLQHAVATRSEPIALVIQGFRAEGDPLWSRGPTDDSTAGAKRWLQHPRVISGWVFDWASRANLTGLADLPHRGALEAAMGVA